MPSAYTMNIPKCPNAYPSENYSATSNKAWRHVEIAGGQKALLGSRDLDAVWALRDMEQDRRQAERDASWAVRMKAVR